ncbi:MAG: outer membrane lipoprotein carrier protein LolA [Desulfobulbaceae bacterium]|nr:outer membrane lipoprotein carrier protein LolA [Desulfobulbaceae bacterium]
MRYKYNCLATGHSNILFLLTFVICCLSSWNVFAVSEVDELKVFLATVKQRVAQTGSVSCKFEQRRSLAVFSKPVIFHGRMAVQRPDKLRWENISPVPSVMIFSGDSGIRCNDDAEPVRFDLASDPVMKMVAEQIWTWADSAYDKLRDQYRISLTAPYVVELVPLGGQLAETVASIQVTFGSLSLQPENVLILEKEGDKTELRFYNYISGRSLDETLFTSCYQ